MRFSLSRLLWGAIDPIANAVELARCWIVDRLAGPIPESETGQAIREAGDRRFRNDPGE
jgi:hypothetical protein